MRLEDQVVSLELAKRLKELGVFQSSLFRWQEQSEGWALALDNLDGMTMRTNHIAAFTVAELGELLPFNEQDPHVEANKAFEGKPGWIGFLYFGGKVEIFPADTEADARAKMLIHLIEQ